MIARLIKISVSLAVYCIDRIVLLKRRILHQPRQGKYVILYYHSVDDSARHKFSKQMDYIKKKYLPVPLDNSLRSGNDRDVIAITFDDGLESVYKNAVPELVKRNIPFAVFVPSGYIGKTSKWIKNKALYKEENVMTVDQLIELSQMDIATIGSHGVRHEGLLDMSDEKAKYEIVQSKNDLEVLLKNEIVFFSFPHGKYSQGHLRHLMDAGYLKAYSIEPQLGKTGDFVLGRFSATPDDWHLEQKLKLSGAYRWLSSIASIKN